MDQKQDEIAHCIGKIVELTGVGRDDRRAVLQVGYNLGRLSELTGLGREPFWDHWKEPISNWDVSTLQRLARELQVSCLPDLVPGHD